VLGSYYLCPNQQGGGAHVCNCGFVTASGAGPRRGTGDAGRCLGARQGRRLSRDAIHFVVETNTRAVATWQRAGFDIVGRLPGAFLHPTEGYVDALVMYRVV